MVLKRHRLSAFILLAIVLTTIAPSVVAQGPEGAQATTELSCSFSMEKDETAEPCHVHFPKGCLVAQLPGTTQPWTSISKGGRLQCRFDEKKTDWKTNIVGTCGRCQSVHCSAQFSVRFDCSGQP